jgi:hypothetical protein
MLWFGDDPAVTWLTRRDQLDKDRCGRPDCLILQTSFGTAAGVRLVPDAQFDRPWRITSDSGTGWQPFPVDLEGFQSYPGDLDSSTLYQYRWFYLSDPDFPEALEAAIRACPI